MPLSVAICFLIIKQVWSDRICLLDILNVYSMYCFAMCSLFHLTVIAWERYVAIVEWTNYKAIVTRGLVKKLKLVVWLLAISLTVPALITEMVGVAIKISQILFIVWCVVGTVAIILIVYFYVMLYIEVRKRNISEISRVSALVKAKLESKVAKTTAILTGTLFLSFLPAFVMYMAGEAVPVLRSSSAFLVWETLMQLNSLANPILYCYRNPRVRKAVMELVRRSSGATQQVTNTVRFVRPAKDTFGAKEDSPEWQYPYKPTRLTRAASCELAVVKDGDHQRPHLMKLTRCISAPSLSKASSNSVEVLQLHKPSTIVITTAAVHDEGTWRSSKQEEKGKTKKSEIDTATHPVCHSSIARSKSWDATISEKFSKRSEVKYTSLLRRQTVPFLSSNVDVGNETLSGEL